MEENTQQPPPALQVSAENVNVDIDTRLSASQVEEVYDGRRRMAWVALIALILPTFYIIGFITDHDLVDKFGDLMSWYYLSLASIVCAYFGFKSWSSIRGK